MNYAMHEAGLPQCDVFRSLAHFDKKFCDNLLATKVDVVIFYVSDMT